MKTSRVLGLVGTALLVGFLASHWCFAQPAQPPSNNRSATDNFIALHELDSFVSYLQDTKQTNTLNRFNEYMNVTLASQHSAELGVRLHVLDHLRNGRTNEAMRMLELQMTSDVAGFARSYRELPADIREKVSLTAIKEARDYCNKYEIGNGQPIVDQALRNAFSVLHEDATH